MPFEIIDSNSRVAEVRLICDDCGKFIGSRVMLKSQVEAIRKKRVICHNCKETRNGNKPES
ncbi:MAG: hypothetical protein NWF00_10465 [Candidatus Bathyarchaeota archaeon]|nr:hypothetical protein [Candidatus Bathyarchaeota archaeon]